MRVHITRKSEKQGISDCLKSVKISLISEMQARCSFLVKTTKLVFNSEWIMANFRRFVTSIAVIIMCSAYFLALFSKKIQQLKISEQTLHYWIKNLQQHQSRASGLEMYINLNLSSFFQNYQIVNEIQTWAGQFTIFTLSKFGNFDDI